jgi:PAS domain S-box-containing protein
MNALLDYFSKKELLKMSMFELHPETELKHSSQVLDAMEKKEMLTTETKFVRKDGSVFLAEATPCKYTLGNKEIIHVVIRDITQRKKAEKALKESEEKYREMTNLLPQIVYEMDLHGNINYINKKAFEIFGYSQEMLIKGINVLNALIPEDRKRAKENINQILNGSDTENNEFEYSGITQVAIKIPIIKKSYEKKINLTYLGFNIDSIMTSDVLFSNIGVFVGGQSMYIDSPISEGSYTSLYWGWEVPLFNMPTFSGTNMEIIGFWEVPTVSLLVGRFVKTNFFDLKKELSNYSLYFYMKNTLSYFDTKISYSLGIGVGTGLYF